jgi:hypothetical protein
LLPILAVALAVLAALPAGAQPLVDAGPDQQITLPAAALLQGIVDLSPAAFWIADGNGVAEDHVVTWHEVNGVGMLTGTLQDSAGLVYGWPSGLIRVGSVVYGVDTFRERVYTLDPLSSIVTPLSPKIGPGTGWSSRLGCLAHDPTSDRIYMVDWRVTPNRLFAVDRATGTPIPAQGVALRTVPFGDVRGLVYAPAIGLFYLYDAATRAIYTLDPATGATAFVVAPDHGAGDYYDDLALEDGDLYGSLHQLQSGEDVIQVKRFDLTTGEAFDLGPAIVGTGGHSLLIESLPERVVWSVDSGPGLVSFADDRDPLSEAVFSAPGSYVLRLTVLAEPPIFDTVTVTAHEACSNGLDDDGDGLVDFDPDPDAGDPGCDDPLDASERSESAALPCDDGQDNDGDLLADYPADPGCRDPLWQLENPQCQDGLNNDPSQDALIDFDGGVSAGLPPEQQTAPDPGCAGVASNLKERPQTSRCGLGFEVALVLPPLAAWRRRRKQQSPPPRIL